MRRFGWLFAALLWLACAGVAWADEFSLPGLEADANAYESSLTARFPAGGTPQGRKQAETQAVAAAKKQDWAAAAAAWERRIAQGDAQPEQWLALAEVQMHRTPPEARHALEAAWQNFSSTDTGQNQVPALLLMAEALKALDRPAQAIQALEAAAERAPDSKAIAQKLDETRRATGILVSRIATEPETEPPRACIAFTVAPIRRDDFHPEDWVKLDPSVPGAAVTREGDQICISGLPSGERTRITLRAGMPGEGGLSLVKDTSLNVAMANRRPRIDFDTRMFVLPRGQTPAIGLSTVNLSSVKLTLARLTERNVVGFVRDSRLGQPVDTWDADKIGEQSGRIVWQGSADIPTWQANRTAHTALPMPDALAASGPGLYALIARAGDGTPNTQAAVQMILRTDFAPTAWRGADGLTVQVRGYSDAKPRAAATLRLLAENNEILGETTTDADGVGRFAAPLLHGTGPAGARAVEVLGGDDYTLLDLSSAAFDLSDRGVIGLPHPGPLDAYVWLDRGIYRPGETVQVMALLRDDAGKPADIPAHVIVRRPNGQVFLDTTPPRAAEASIHLPVTLSTGAPAGTWTIEVKAEPGQPPIGSAQFRVDAFVPDRMAVDLAPATGPIVPGQPYSLPVSARFLYGAPAGGLTGQGQMRLIIDPAPFPVLAGYRIGLENETYAPDATDLTLADTDAQGAFDADHCPAARARYDACAEGVDNRRRERSVRSRLSRQRGNPGAAGGQPYRHQAGVCRQRGGCGNRGGVRHRRGRSDRCAYRLEGEAAAGARAAGLAAGHARQSGTLRNGVARRTAGDQFDRYCGGRAVPFRQTARFWPLPHRGAGGWRHGGHLNGVPLRLGFLGQSGRAGSGGRLGRAQGVRAGRYGTRPHRPAVCRRGDIAGADRSRPSACATCRCPPAAPMSMCRYPPTGGRAPTSRCTCSAPPPTRNRAPAAPSGWPGSASIQACASCRWHSMSRTNTRRARAP